MWIKFRVWRGQARGEERSQCGQNRAPKRIRWRFGIPEPMFVFMSVMHGGMRDKGRVGG